MVQEVYAAHLTVSERTVRRVKRRYVEEGLERVLQHHNSPHPYPKVGGKVEAHPVSSTGQALIAVACSPAPEGRGPWTLRARQPVSGFGTSPLTDLFLGWVQVRAWLSRRLGHPTAGDL